MQDAAQGTPGHAGRTTVTVTGQGTASGTPDLAYASVSVQTSGATAAEATRKNAEIMTAVLQELRAAGLAPGDVQTTGLHVSPVRASLAPPPPPGQPVPTEAPLGYWASNSLTVTVQDVSRLGGLLDAMVGAGATEIHGVRFGVRDRAALEHQALAHALAAARAKADLLAAQLGLHIAGVASVQEGWGHVEERAQLRAVFTDTPIEAPEYTVSAQVQAVFHLA